MCMKGAELTRGLQLSFDPLLTSPAHVTSGALPPAVATPQAIMRAMVDAADKMEIAEAEATLLAGGQ
jgi:hypothetical protein